MKKELFWEKLRNLSEIMLLPHGLRLKLRHRNFHWRDYRFCLRLKTMGIEPQSIFDIGANEGQFAIGAMSVFPNSQIYSYEPGRAAFGRLKKAFGGIAQVELNNIAVGKEMGEATLHVATSDQSSSLLTLHRNHLEAYPTIHEVAKEVVAVTTLAKEFGRKQPLNPILLKIDTQGFEFQVLQGARETLQCVKWVVIETSTRPMYHGEVLFGEISEWLHEHGFAFTGPVELHVDCRGMPCQFDAVFTRNKE
jgi:FkbM family methyltransferase